MYAIITWGSERLLSVETLVDVFEKDSTSLSRVKRVVRFLRKFGNIFVTAPTKD
jgi:hypothetical protein